MTLHTSIILLLVILIYTMIIDASKLIEGARHRKDLSLDREIILIVADTTIHMVSHPKISEITSVSQALNCLAWKTLRKTSPPSCVNGNRS